MTHLQNEETYAQAKQNPAYFDMINKSGKGKGRTEM
jgi:hypothetical protein